MSKRDRRDMDGRDRDRRDGYARDYQPDEEQQRRAGEGEIQEGDSVTALKTILSKVATQLKPLNLTAEESIRLVEQLYGSVLDMDVALASEADDTRKSSTLAYIQKTNIRRDGDRLVVEYPTAEELRATEAPGAEAGVAPQTEAALGAPAAQAPAREAGAAQPPRGSVPRPAPPRQERSEQPRRVDPAEQPAAGRPESDGPEA